MVDAGGKYLDGRPAPKAPGAAPDAAHRFVIIDGTRLAEGDRVADATISAILADGVTLAWRGRQIRLPIR